MSRFAFRSLQLSCFVLLSGLVGCSHYVAPGRGADMGAMGLTPEARQQQTDFGMRGAFDRKPLAHFPAAIAVARVQAPEYRSRTAESWGRGSYSIVTTRDIEGDKLDKLTRLPMIDGIAPIGRLSLMPMPVFKTDQELRYAAAQLQADMLLIYTINTAFYVRDMATPITVISLGLSPTQEARVTTTASAVLLDTRNGYIYGSAEATEQNNRLASAWTSENAIDAARLQTESAAFDKLVAELQRTWTGVVKRYAPATQPAVGG